MNNHSNREDAAEEGVKEELSRTSPIVDSYLSFNHQL